MRLQVNWAASLFARFGNMSKIGKIPVVIPGGVTVNVQGSQVTVTGPKGTLNYIIPSGLKAVVADGKITVFQEKGQEEKTSAGFGLTRATIQKYADGVSKGFEKKLELVGVGYRAQATPNELTLSLGFSHPVKIKAPVGITFSVVDGIIIISGADAALVGNTAAHIRAIKKPEPYKGKGIKYVGEKIRRKAGKAAKAVGGAAGAK